MNLELISFNICPFVQRSVITLLYKGAEFDVTYIDLEEPPAWFRTISPLGKVPLLKVDGEVLFESAVINEFVDEVTPGSLLPEEPLPRARARAWIEFASECIFGQFQMAMAADEATYNTKRAAFVDNLRTLEGQLPEGGEPYFDGRGFSLVDAAVAPLLMRNRLLNGAGEFMDEADFPGLSRWTDAMLAMEAVQDSVPENFEQAFFEHIRKSGGYGAERFAS